MSQGLKSSKGFSRQIGKGAGPKKNSTGKGVGSGKIRGSAQGLKRSLKHKP